MPTAAVSAYSVSWWPRNVTLSKTIRSAVAFTATAWVAVISGCAARSNELRNVSAVAVKPFAAIVAVALPVVPYVVPSGFFVPLALS